MGRIGPGVRVNASFQIFRILLQSAGVTCGGNVSSSFELELIEQFEYAEQL